MPEGLTDKETIGWLPPVWACTLCPNHCAFLPPQGPHFTASLRAWTSTWRPGGQVPPRGELRSEVIEAPCRISSVLWPHRSQ